MLLFFCIVSNDTKSNRCLLEDSKTTGGAALFSKASLYLKAHKHQWSPFFNPGNWYYGIGVIKSFPLDFVNYKNLSFTFAHTTCVP